MSDRKIPPNRKGLALLSKWSKPTSEIKNSSLHFLLVDRFGHLDISMLCDLESKYDFKALNNLARVAMKQNVFEYEFGSLDCRSNILKYRLLYLESFLYDVIWSQCEV